MKEKFPRIDIQPTGDIVEMKGADDDVSLDAAQDDAVRIVHEKKLAYPILVAPWGENSDAHTYVAGTEEELRDAVESAMKGAIHARRVHILSMHAHERKQQYPPGTYPGEGTIK